MSGLETVKFILLGSHRVKTKKSYTALYGYRAKNKMQQKLHCVEYHTFSWCPILRWRWGRISTWKQQILINFVPGSARCSRAWLPVRVKGCESNCEAVTTKSLEEERFKTELSHERDEGLQQTTDKHEALFSSSGSLRIAKNTSSASASERTNHPVWTFKYVYRTFGHKNVYRSKIGKTFPT